MLWGWFVLNKEAHTDWEMIPDSHQAASKAPSQVA